MVLILFRMSQLPSQVIRFEPKPSINLGGSCMHLIHKLDTRETLSGNNQQLEIVRKKDGLMQLFIRQELHEISIVRSLMG